MLEVLHVAAFEDNYIWLIYDQNKQVVIVDPGDATPILAAVSDLSLTPVAILCTHHHYDHIGGVAEIVNRFRVPVYGPVAEQIQAVSDPVDDGDKVNIPSMGLELEVLAVPGHTGGHIAYYGHNMLFCGDTLFSGGCGRLFEGTAEQMTKSLSKLAQLPNNTRIYCAHEYTAANLRFAKLVEPDNINIINYLSSVTEKRSRNEPSLPSSMALEKKINPFLRTGENTVIQAANQHSSRKLQTQTEVFAEIRRWKDGYRG